LKCQRAMWDDDARDSGTPAGNLWSGSFALIDFGDYRRGDGKSEGLERTLEPLYRNHSTAASGRSARCDRTAVLLFLGPHRGIACSAIVFDMERTSIGRQPCDTPIRNHIRAVIEIATCEPRRRSKQASPRTRFNPQCYPSKEEVVTEALIG